MDPRDVYVHIHTELLPLNHELADQLKLWYQGEDVEKPTKDAITSALGGSGGQAVNEALALYDDLKPDGE